MLYKFEVSTNHPLSEETLEMLRIALEDFLLARTRNIAIAVSRVE
jgi:hypothetical protein